MVLRTSTFKTSRGSQYYGGTVLPMFTLSDQIRSMIHNSKSSRESTQEGSVFPMLILGDRIKNTKELQRPKVFKLLIPYISTGGKDQGPT